MLGRHYGSVDGRHYGIMTAIKPDYIMHQKIIASLFGPNIGQKKRKRSLGSKKDTKTLTSLSTTNIPQHGIIGKINWPVAQLVRAPGS